MKFPASAPVTIKCVYCPEMCRFSCPTAVVSGNDAVTPCNKMSTVYKEEKWPGRQGTELWNLYDCTGCGRCTNYCVYGQPVMETLFAARAEHGWEPARAAAAALTDADDPAGDLAAELGDVVAGTRRAQQLQAGPGVVEVEEPKQVHHLAYQGRSAALSWQLASGASAARAALKLDGKRWLYHESGWHNRHLGRAGESDVWLKALREAGATIEVPFHHGADCIDCGGEGAYARISPQLESQAATMARDVWERDQHRADGVLCVSRRCADHFRKLGIAAISLPEIVSTT